MAVLIDTSRPERPTFELGTSTVLGRDPGSTIPVPDRLMSRTHAEIRPTPEGGYLIVDLGSSHGTWVMGRRISECVLSHGDEIIVGATRFRFYDNESAEKATNVSVAARQDDPYIQQRMEVSEATHFRPHQEVEDVEELRGDYEKLLAAYELSRAMGAEQDLDALLSCVVDTAFKMFPADRMAILLVDPATGWPTPRISRRRTGDDNKIVLSKTIISEVVRTKSSMLLADAGLDVRFGEAKSVIGEGVRSAMCVPIMFGDELLGVMHLDSLLATRLFTETDLGLLSTVANQAGVAVKNAMLSQRIQDEAKARVRFQRFLPPTLVDQLLAGDLTLGNTGELREVTVLFSDIRGFTKMSESMDPGAVMSMLNGYFEVMIEVLFRHGGTFDKYVGDELMALFGAPTSMPSAPLAAVVCAMDMQKELVGFNERLEKSGQAPIAIGIGIHTGQALCGTLGSSKTMQYTAIGDTVNTASRLCSVAGPDQVLMSAVTMELVHGDVEVRALPAVVVKGKSEALEIFDTVRRTRAQVSDSFPKHILEWADGAAFLEAYDADSAPGRLFWSAAPDHLPDNAEPGAVGTFVIRLAHIDRDVDVHLRVLERHVDGAKTGLLLEFLAEERGREQLVSASARGAGAPFFRRNYQRFSCDLSTGLTVPNHSVVQGKVIEMSEGGCRLRVEEPLEIGAVLNMSIDFPGAPATLRGVVRSVIPSGPNQGYGIEFQLDSSEQSEELIEAIEVLRRSSQVPG